MIDEDTEAIVDEQQFWAGEQLSIVTASAQISNTHLHGRTTELRDIVTTPCTTHEAIDDALRSFIEFTSRYKRMLHPVLTAHGAAKLTGARGTPAIGIRHCALLLPTARLACLQKE